MKGSIMKKVIKIAGAEYEIFSNLPLKLRLQAVLALILLFFALVILMHLAINPFLDDGVESFNFLFMFYFIIFILSVLTVLPILFPRLQKKSSVLLFFICCLNSFPLSIIPFLIPKLRKYKTTMIGVIVFIIILIAGLVVMAVGTKEGILIARPGSTTILLWLLGSIAVFSGIILYGFVTEKISIEKVRIETEIKLAQKIQTQLVPLIEMTGKRYQIYGMTNPASQVGGDFFDVVKISEKKIVLAIGDVSGHNIAAGLLMSITKGAFRTGLHYTPTLENLVESMNQTILENSDKKMFVSFKCCEINLDENCLTVVNAGHLPILHYSSQDKKILQWKHSGIALGLLKDIKLETQKIPFNKGDVFFFITDGIVEAVNSLNEEFGYDRVTNRLKHDAEELAPKQIYENIVSDLRHFTNSQTFEDDVTFLAVKLM
jgi:hypothetical protein